MLIQTTNVTEIIFAGVVGVLTPMSVDAEHSAHPPIDTTRNFSAHVSAKNLKNNIQGSSKCFHLKY
jgi:hypothetical protein